MANYCKGICSKFKALKPFAARGRYITGQKRCKVCSIFIKWEGLWCPCCKCRLRMSPRSSKDRRTLREKLQLVSKLHT